jgi:hypothetical protein
MQFTSTRIRIEAITRIHIAATLKARRIARSMFLPAASVKVLDVGDNAPGG